MKVHIAISVSNLNNSIAEYTKFLNKEPDLVIKNDYALWRTEVLNLSLRVTNDKPGIVRHVGFENDEHSTFSEFKDSDGVVWELFNKSGQAEEINKFWPDVEYKPR